jgi:hypothetical protein
MRYSAFALSLLASVALSSVADAQMNKHDRSIATYSYDIDVTETGGVLGEGDLQKDIDTGVAKEGLMPRAKIMPAPVVQQAPIKPAPRMMPPPAREPVVEAKPEPMPAEVKPQPAPEPELKKEAPMTQPPVPVSPEGRHTMPVPAPAPEAKPMPPHQGMMHQGMPPVPSPMEQKMQQMMERELSTPPKDEMSPPMPQPKPMSFKYPPSHPKFLDSLNRENGIAI